MSVEYDPAKSAESKGKHGIDFEEAKILWSDPGLIEIPARVSDEPRWAVIGKINDQLDLAKARHAGTDPKRVNVDIPGRMGVTRQSLIKLWLADRLGQKVAAVNRRS